MHVNAKRDTSVATFSMAYTYLPVVALSSSKQVPSPLQETLLVAKEISIGSDSLQNDRAMAGYTLTSYHKTFPVPTMAFLVLIPLHIS